MKTFTQAILIAACLLMGATGYSQQVAKSIPYAGSPDGVIGFLEFRPSDYGSQKHPLIIFLAGIGERGNGSSGQVAAVAANGIPNLCANGASMRFTVAGQTSSFVVLSPQLSVMYGSWPPYYIKEMMKYAKANLQIDTNRIYITGLSLGGGGIWRAITDATNGDYSFDGTIAAAAPVCGLQEESDGNMCSTIAANHLPVWAFHSVDDGTVPVGCTQHAEILLSWCSGISPAPKFTYYQTGNHGGAWVNAYDTGHITRTVNGGGSFTANPNLYEWFLSNTRATNTAPLTTAGSTQTITLPSNTATLTGAGTGTNGASISSYAWVKTSGPAAGSISTPGAAITGLTGLVQGTYVFTLTSTDNHALSSNASVTVKVLAPLVANAGASQVIATTSATLSATSSYSPNGAIASYSWQQVSGPIPATIVNAGTSTATISDMVQGGDYSFKLTVTDMAGASGTATTDVTVLFALLPVQFTYVKVGNNGAGNLLQWGTANGQNGDYFSIERSADAKQFDVIGKTNGAGTATGDYTYTDTKAGSGVVYYRIRQVDKDGRFTLSQPVQVNNSSRTAAIQMYPNPMKDNLTIVIENETKGKGQIAVYESAGRMINKKGIEKNGNVLNTTLNMNDLAAGLYIVEIKIGDNYKYARQVMKK